MSAAHVATAPEPRQRTSTRSRVLRRPATVVGLSLVAAFVLVAVFAPLIAPHSPRATDFTATLAHSSWRHPLGTDQLGRDELSRLVYGARVALLVALASTALALLVAVPLGLVSGYYGGLVDATIARAGDVLLAFPFLLLAIGLRTITGPSLVSATFVLAFAGSPALIRIVRGETLSLRESEFVAAAIAAGARDGRILFRHLLPNVANTLLVQAPLFAARVIVAEAALAFLGLSVRPPTATWGGMLSDAHTYMYQAPRLAVYPGIAIALATVAFIVVGDALRDALDPQSRR